MCAGQPAIRFEASGYLRELFRLILLPETQVVESRNSAARMPNAFFRWLPRRSIVMLAALVSAIAPLADQARTDSLRANSDGLRHQIAATADNPCSEAGISGQVTIGPVRPHATPGTPNKVPYEATVQVLDLRGQPVTTFRSDAAGNFCVALPPGQYVLRPQSSGPYPRAPEQTVIVSPNGFTHVLIMYDSGMR